MNMSYVERAVVCLDGRRSPRRSYAEQAGKVERSRRTCVGLVAGGVGCQSTRVCALDGMQVE